MFWNKKIKITSISSDEYKELSNELIKMDRQLKMIQSQLEINQLQIDTLRGNFSRKLKGLQIEEKKVEEEKPKTETLNNDMYLPLG